MRLTLAAFSALFIAQPTLAATAEPTSSAFEWLQLVDSGKYAQSYAEGSAIFHSRITELAFEQKTKLYRDATGPIKFRAVDGVSMVGDLQNLPPGQYAIVRYHSKFANQPAAVETVYLTLENGLWRVAAYDISSEK
jgi:hypothetical protein